MTKILIRALFYSKAAIGIICDRWINIKAFGASTYTTKVLKFLSSTALANSLLSIGFIQLVVGKTFIAV